MNKLGFVSIIVLITIFTVLVFITSNINTYEDDKQSYTIFLQTKNTISNYTILINQISQNCFFEHEEILINECIENNYNNTLEIMNMHEQPYNCLLTNFGQEDQNTFYSILNCNVIIENNNNIIFSNEFSTPIVIKKADIE